MSESNQTSSNRFRRPKRLPVKSNDDNVLGISWKEERELRKAMYVSLRQHQRVSSGPRLRSGRMNITTPPKDFRSAISWKQKGTRTPHTHLQPSDRNKPQFAKRRVTPRLPTQSKSATSKNLQAAGRMKKREKEIGSTPNVKTSSNHLSRTPRTMSQKTRTVLSVARSIVRARVNGLHSVSRQRPTANCCSRGNGRMPRRPTLISASNVSELTPGRRKNDSVVESAQRSSPFNDPRMSSYDNRCASLQNSATKSRYTRLRKLDGVHPQCRLFVTPDGPLSKKFCEPVPRELRQDPEGRPVSVHDFVDFICYHGTPCLDPKLKWLSQTHCCSPTSVSQSTQSHSPNSMPKSGINHVNNPVNSLGVFSTCFLTVPTRVRSADESDDQTSSTLPLSRNTKIRVAKKLASVHPSNDSRTVVLVSDASRTPQRQLRTTSHGRTQRSSDAQMRKFGSTRQNKIRR